MNDLALYRFSMDSRRIYLNNKPRILYSILAYILYFAQGTFDLF